MKIVPDKIKSYESEPDEEDYIWIQMMRKFPTRYWWHIILSVLILSIAFVFHLNFE